MLPNFLIIGAERSGTTWLLRSIRLHPEIYTPRKKELRFFDLEYERGIGYYASLFRPGHGEKRVGEASPTYLYCAQAAARIAEHLPRARLIASLRNPVDRLYSLYWLLKTRDRAIRALSFRAFVERHESFVATGCYGDDLQRYFARFPREQICVLLFDDLLASPGACLEQVYSFLGVDPDFRSPLTDTPLNAARSNERLGRSRILWLLHRASFWAGLYGLSGSFERRNRAEIPPMPDDVRRTLVQRYAEPNRRLGELLGRDLEHWNR